MKGDGDVIYGTGIDLTEIARIESMLQAGLKLPEKVLTPAELTVFQSYGQKRRAEFLAGRFSAKESYSKAFGTGIGAQVGFQDIEILDNALGRPAITKHPFDGPAWVSISHTDQLVMTQVILERGNE
ncbi:holo-ACP synthase [Lactobacillus sp.] [Lactiplantibacillus mudanjiangensis]|uniref:Holo-[acyl-carrier-protein] synthase n=1 Tax=Lactiplantibacillus mudanjiangensis TaxID=1296538 RepID=A0A660E0Z6_9LACO|nr:holo-ACP synthase [Lactobacillus sp.] [Lactiplantibacillus mudanjiangensis]VDG26117.1 holo-ACP synthase [Lactobacillus sp.] [Lactiplantibacillus mudanjiangensis]VDG29044.1 holo-ACP synthase [Lactobacillus sp.] [Lactiplantibacillus mudanjiangensis]VDG31562.1 holo-ACP synthase [Lactobacillus sp.] [Lactiplantibacillus mudanjiangensis]